MAIPHDTYPPVEVALPEASAAPGRARMLRGLWSLARPRQWVKNVLVFAAPGAAGVLLDPRVAGLSAVAFGCFCLAASGIYYLNDACDAEADRLHPRKRLRPVAAGIVPPGLARLLGMVFLGASVAVAALAAGPKLALVLGIYVALMSGYSTRFKQIPVVELAVVASGFVFRAVAGGVATAIPISPWFLIVVSFSSLFVVVGKRFAEHTALGEDSASHRASLGEYTPAFLRYVGALSSAVAIIAYCLWAFTRYGGGMVFYELSVVPFVLGVMYYALQADKGLAGAPEELLLTDRTVQAIGVGWIVLFLAGVYGA